MTLVSVGGGRLQTRRGTSGLAIMYRELQHPKPGPLSSQLPSMLAPQAARHLDIILVKSTKGQRFRRSCVLLWRFGRLRRSGGGRRGGSYRALLDRDCVIRRTLRLELQVLHTGYHGLVPLGSTIQVRHQCCR